MVVNAVTVLSLATEYWKTISWRYLLMVNIWNINNIKDYNFNV